ncbi:ribbon-helix-helix domain-containing protein [Brevifollis gellanilyticus]|uniref:CopG family transcriptional regulator n=1 Tax=Brevifollis gellanilyticus TaxID=748831 RepID=A0A512M5P5_9BACT|nr:type II toxin-antitoxin system ParD family antitoxin [Brevifollis gellanilyticus]GEP42058.1 hypothetical protein BGE01nite_13490 [Brevifollis gellanilyticus]
MKIVLPPALSALVERLMQTGRYADEGEVVRAALRALEHQEFDEPLNLESAILSGVHSQHILYDASVLDRVRLNAAI